MRLLFIDDDAEYRKLLRHHVMCRWPRATVVEYDPVARGALPPEIRADGFDAVLLDHSWTGGRGIDWLADLAQRPGFAPIVFLSDGLGDATALRAWALGASAVFGKEKINHEALLNSLAASADRQMRASIERDMAEGSKMHRFSGARIPGYRRVRRLAAGQLSRLYVAEHETHAELVVIKVARDRVEENDLDHSFKRFLLEHEIARRVGAPSVVCVHDLGVSDEHAYLVMEYFPAGDLRKRMRAGLSPVEALRFALDVARALETLHGAGILHRDLKPGNVMLRDDGTVTLIDFGLAKHAALELSMTDHGLIFGTPHYMSPEQGHGEPTDARSDLYSLGVILYEMLTAQKPYVAENPMAIIYLHRKAPVPALPEPLAALQPLLAGLLAKRPEDRFPSASAAATALEGALRELHPPELAA
jgi:serine/threonine protein kinase/CheY-like chemotaxis protein